MHALMTRISAYKRSTTVSERTHNMNRSSAIFLLYKNLDPTLALGRDLKDVPAALENAILAVRV